MMNRSLSCLPWPSLSGYNLRKHPNSIVDVLILNQELVNLGVRKNIFGAGFVETYKVYTNPAFVIVLLLQDYIRKPIEIIHFHDKAPGE